MPKKQTLCSREVEAMQKTGWGADDSGWIHFSLTKASWVPFSVHPSIQQAMLQIETVGSEQLGDWLHRAEGSVNMWIIDQILGREGRAQRFRNLGRGWLFVFLQRAERKFKWWFESIGRVTANHKSDIEDLNLTPELVDKYTNGYMHNCELVICMKGMLPPGYPRKPMISIMKMASEYLLAHRWATNEETKKAIASPFPSDSDRQASALKSQKRREKRAKKKQAKANKKVSEAPDAEPAAAEPEELDGTTPDEAGGGFQMRKYPLADAGASLAFETMLQEMKQEENATDVESTNCSSVEAAVSEEDARAAHHI